MTPPTRTGPGRPRLTDYPKRIGPYRATQETWDLLDHANALTGITKRDLVEEGIAQRCREAIATHNGGTTHDRQEATREEGRAEAEAAGA